MSPERDDPTDDHELYEDVPPRSIFAATWFRVVLVLIVLGVFGAVAVPYVLDWMNPPTASRSVSVKATSPVPPAAPLPASESAASSSASTSSSADKSSSAEKKDPTLVPPPAPPSLARPAPKAETTAKSSMAVTESNPKTAAKSEAPAKTDSAPKPAPPAKTEAAPKPQVVAKAEPGAKDETKTAAATTPPATKRAAAKATPPANPAHKVTGPFWVQVGAFKDPDTAKRVATALRDQNFKVEESDTQVGARTASAPASTGSAASSPAASPGDLYDVYVSGMSAVELTKRLSAKGLAAEASGGGVVVKPSLPLRDAVTLSKELAVDGLKVQVRRAGSGAVAAAPAATTPAPAAGAGQTLHRVRVGGFTDAAAARAAAKELEAKGYKPYIARGDE